MKILGGKKNSRASMLFTPKLIQEIFGCSYKTVLEIFKTQGFPAMKIGGRYFVEQQDLFIWLKQNPHIAYRLYL